MGVLSLDKMGLLKIVLNAGKDLAILSLICNIASSVDGIVMKMNKHS